MRISCYLISKINYLMLLKHATSTVEVMQHCITKWQDDQLTDYVAQVLLEQLFGWFN
jgi:hypothetical protein